MDMIAFNLHDKYTQTEGKIYLTGIQALARLALIQKQRDLEAGLNTAGFISGYRGSPLGSLDKALWSIGDMLEDHDITFQPGLNEDLAATSLWGTQQINLNLDAKFEGVFGLWYGKGPGLDRSGDVFKHANAAGTAPHGGVLLCMGDDHTAKSSTLPHQSEFAMMDAGIPVLNPASIQEVLDYGLHGWAMSRYSGCWTGLKTISETMDSSTSVSADIHRVQIIQPHDFEPPEDGLHIRLSDTPQERELRLQKYKLYAAIAYVRANNLNRIVFDSPKPRLGIITTGKSYLDVRQALRDLGIDSKLAYDLGIRLYKIAMPWPLDKQGVRDFASGLEEILVVEEKRALIENQLKELLYNAADEERPRVVGKFDEHGKWLLPSMDELTVAQVARVVAARIGRFATSETIRARLAFLVKKEHSLQKASLSFKRQPHFCSGCPHNTSTRVPEGSVAEAGIGCHYMVTWMNRKTDTFTQMGGEGAPWIGQAPFCNTDHIFVNLGDGTYFHSGSLAIRASIAAGVNVTYKILYNAAVAMTGGQPLDGELSISQLTHQLKAEGVKRIAIVTDNDHNYRKHKSPEASVEIHPRSEFDQVQLELREVKGVSILIYDQMCATEKRRMIKRGNIQQSTSFAYINSDICENCGDCSRKSNCLSVVPVDTPMGTKRKIDQASCNHDLSCIDGFCPSFVTINGQRKASTASILPANAEALDEPELPDLETPYSIVVTGVGGTGIVTLSAILGVAAHIDGKGINVLDMTGLAQKFGAVSSHLQIAKSANDIHATRIAAGHANLLLGCDAITACSEDVLAKLDRDHSHAVINEQTSITSNFIQHPDTAVPMNDVHSLMNVTIKKKRAHFMDSVLIARKTCGDPIASNMVMVGYAWQLGLIPLTRQSIEQAIEINKVSIQMNTEAFAWGRRLADDAKKVEDELVITIPAAPSLDEIITQNTRWLSEYQDDALAERYTKQIESIRHREQTEASSEEITRVIAQQYPRFLAIKDEYEVARLLTSDKFKAELDEQFEPGYELKYSLAPPGMNTVRNTGAEPRKQQFGKSLTPILKTLARVRKIRNTWADPFRFSKERKTDIDLLNRYESLLDHLRRTMDARIHGDLLKLAQSSVQIRGFGHIREDSVRNITASWPIKQVT